ncbi:hypothetical protein NS14008_12065 [Nocardia seriolae]|nr:hypothetical protein NS14008_12065 [Nocardia seriolae]
MHGQDHAARTADARGQDPAQIDPVSIGQPHPENHGIGRGRGNRVQGSGHRRGLSDDDQLGIGIET